MIKPDYDHSLVNLISAIESSFGSHNTIYSALPELPVAEIAAARNVVLWLLDGLGYHYLKQHSTRLQGYLRGSMDSVFPSSTAPAITSLMTGCAPQQHAVTGWFMQLDEVDAVTMLLPFKARAGTLPQDAAVANLIGAAPMFSRLDYASHIVITEALCDSEYSRATGGTAWRHGYRGLEACLDCLQQVVGKGHERQFIYAYWPAFDALAHRYGVASPEVRAHFDELEQAIVELIEQLRGSDTLLVISADHGFIDCPPEHVLLLNDHPELQACLRHPLCGEPRAAYAYVQPQRLRLFTDYLEAELRAELSWYPAAELIDAGWFGKGRPDPRLAARIGDIVLLPKDDRIVIDRLENEPPWGLIGVHGGLSEAEKKVPLVVAQC